MELYASKLQIKEQYSRIPSKRCWNFKKVRYKQNKQGGTSVNEPPCLSDGNNPAGQASVLAVVFLTVIAQYFCSFTFFLPGLFRIAHLLRCFGLCFRFCWHKFKFYAPALPVLTGTSADFKHEMIKAYANACKQPRSRLLVFSWSCLLYSYTDISHFTDRKKACQYFNKIVQRVPGSDLRDIYPCRYPSAGPSGLPLPCG